MSGRSGAQSASRKTVLHTPALQALLLQILALFIAGPVIFGLAALLGRPPGLLGAACIQGVCAAALSGWRHLAPWWLAIQFLFPVALVLALPLHLSPVLFLCAFLFFLLLYWSTFRTQVPFYPSGQSVQQALATLLPQDGSIRFIDIGSGLGGLVLHLAGRFADGHFVGIEIAPLPWLLSRLRARCTGSRAHFERGDYNKLDFAGYDVIFAYLSPVAMPALWQKAQAEMRAGSLLLSYEFAIPGITPSLVLVPGPGAASLYGFRM